VVLEVDGRRLVQTFEVQADPNFPAPAVPAAAGFEESDGDR
jgi:hypothetical protein